MYQADGLIHSDTNCHSFKKTANIISLKPKNWAKEVLLANANPKNIINIPSDTKNNLNYLKCRPIQMYTLAIVTGPYLLN